MINYDYRELTGEVITREDFEYEEERKGLKEWPVRPLLHRGLNEWPALTARKLISIISHLAQVVRSLG